MKLNNLHFFTILDNAMHFDFYYIQAQSSSTWTILYKQFKLPSYIFEIIVANHINFDCDPILLFSTSTFFVVQKCVCLPRFLFVGIVLLFTSSIEIKR